MATRFYQEFLDETKTKPTGNVVVIYLETRSRVSGRVIYEGLGRCYPNILQHEETPVDPNQPVTLWTIDDGWLRKFCRPISEKTARRVHPYLFESCMDAEQHEACQHTLLILCAAFLGLAAVSGVVQALTGKKSLLLPYDFGDFIPTPSE